MKKILMIMAMFMVVTSIAQDKSKKRKVDIEVSGLCDMCKARIEKAAFKIKGVKFAAWHVDDQKLHLVINENKTDVLTIQKGMAAIGHDTKDVQATSEAYDNLHGCCKYERTFVKSTCEKDCSKPCCKDKVKSACCASEKTEKTSCSSKK